MTPLTRRTMLRTLAGGAATGVLLATRPSFALEDAKPAKRPNIIFLLTDDQRDNTFSAMGHPWVKTPNLDQLMKGGVRFSNTYIATPVCAPSRISLLTGMSERTHGVGFSSSYKLNESQWDKTYPALLRKSGYYTGFVGKIGVEYYTFRGQADKKFDFWRGHDGWAKFFPKTAKNCKAYWDSKKDIITPVMGESITRFLDSTPKDKPFQLSVSFSVPHGSQIKSMHRYTEPATNNPKLKGHPIYGSLYRDLTIPIPKETATNPYRFIPKRIMDQDKGRRSQCYTYDYTRKHCLEHHIRYYQQITGLDKVIGEMLADLKQRGLDKNTIIIFASDHGLLMGEYGMGGKGLLYDLASKIPCFVYDPRQAATGPGKTVDKLVSSLDIPMTILDYAKVAPPKEMEGKSLRPLVAGEKVPWREELFLESLFTLRDNPFCEGIRRGQWKYIRMFDGVVRFKEKDVNFKGKKPEFEQLFDLSKDPEEKTNLITAMKDSAILRSLRKRCAERSDEVNQRRLAYMKTHKITKR